MTLCSWFVRGLPSALADVTELCIRSGYRGYRRANRKKRVIITWSKKIAIDTPLCFPRRDRTKPYAHTKSPIALHSHHRWV